MHIRLEIEVEYVDSTTTPELMLAQLTYAANFLANNGLLTGEGSAEVENWKFEIGVVNP
jgi:hypothetical protein